MKALRQRIKSKIVKGTMRLDSEGFGDVGFEMVARQELGQIVFADFRIQKVIEGVNAIKKLKPILKMNFINLKQLNLSQNLIGDRGMFYLSKSTLPVIFDIRLQECDISDAGTLHLAKAPFQSLQRINLGRNRINNDGIKHLLKFKGAINLIYLDSNPIGCSMMVLLSNGIKFSINLLFDSNQVQALQLRKFDNFIDYE